MRQQKTSPVTHRVEWDALCVKLGTGHRSNRGLRLGEGGLVLVGPAGKDAAKLFLGTNGRGRGLLLGGWLG
jgi:hypothetical protein